MKLVNIPVTILVSGEQAELVVRVPDKVRYITQDARGDLWWWTSRPHPSPFRWICRSDPHDSGFIVSAHTVLSRWREAIMEV